MRLIADGVVDREGVEGLARRVGYTPRHLTRLLTAELGAGPLALARARRAQTARVLIETTELGFADVAFAAGFASVRQFNDTVREVYAASPTDLRGAPGPGDQPPARSRCGWPCARRSRARALLDFLAYHLVPGVEVAGTGLVRPHPRPAARPRHRPARARRRAGRGRDGVRRRDASRCTTCATRPPRSSGPGGCVDADCDPLAVDDQFAGRPGDRPAGAARRPGCGCPARSTATRSRSAPCIGQQVSVVGACTVAGRLVADARPAGRRPTIPGLTHLFPDAADARRRSTPTTLPMPRARGRALVGLAAALASGDVALDRGPDRDDVRRRAARAARHRAVDGRLRRDARARPPRRLPADRPRRPQRAGRAGPRPGARSSPTATAGGRGAPTP